jgi:hypothetical protein
MTVFKAKYFYLLRISLVLSLISCDNPMPETDQTKSGMAITTKKSSEKQRQNINRESEQVRRSYYYKRLDGIYYFTEKLEGVDTLSFEAVGENHGRDNNFGYLGNKKINSSDGSTFYSIDEIYSADKSHVFYLDSVLEGAVPSAFRVINFPIKARWSTDGKNYYYLHYRVPTNDSAGITILAETTGLCKDANWVYLRNKKLNYLNRETKVIDTIDAASFEMLNYELGRDKFGILSLSHGR